VYCFCDGQGQVLYVGKSVRLRERVRSYFRKRSGLPRSKRAMVRATETIRVQETGSELEALLLEAEWIRTLRPPYNVLLRRQRPPLFLRLDPREPFLPLTLTREVRRDAAHYFGPLGPPEVGEALVRVLQKLLGLRVCSGPLIPHQTHRPCLALELHLCAGPCVGAVSEAAYRERVQQAVEWLSGEDLPLLRVMEEHMQTAAAELRFEEAVHWREGRQVLGALRRPLHLPLAEQTGLLLSPAGQVGEWKALLVRDARLVDSFSLRGPWRATLRRLWRQLEEREPADGEPLSTVELYRIRLLHTWLRRAPERYPFLRWQPDLTPAAAAEWVRGHADGQK
jgi:excinuclease UvrABC nuclease subunit